ncbi:hypothetical protein CN514_12150 [Bacillus sp. AFS001701]|nr:hypothetical protein CN514_12150 [Bacillus sp. AFS001701]
MVRYFQYLLELVKAEKNPIILKELLKLGETLKNPFPYQDTELIQNDYKDFFSEDDCLNADLNTYWMIILSSHNYIIRGKSDEIYKKNLIKWLKLSFFDQFDQYKFLKTNIDKYPIFYKDYLNYEKTRMYILYYLFLERKLLN